MFVPEPHVVYPKGLRLGGAITQVDASRSGLVFGGGGPPCCCSFTRPTLTTASPDFPSPNFPIRFNCLPIRRARVQWVRGIVMLHAISTSIFFTITVIKGKGLGCFWRGCFIGELATADGRRRKRIPPRHGERCLPGNGTRLRGWFRCVIRFNMTST